MTENSIHMALKESMEAKRMAEVKKLIKNGADFCERNEKLETPLHVAISQGFEVIAEIIIKKLSVHRLFSRWPGSCFQRLKHVYGHQSYFCKTYTKWGKNEKLSNNFVSF